MIPTSKKIEFVPDCSTCVHRAKRHPSKRDNPSRPRKHEYICMVTGRAISLHGTYMNHGGWDWQTGEPNQSEWVQDVPCKKFNKKTERWYLVDYERVPDP